jgi:ABC-type sugar transport system permease subunit
MLKTLKYLWFRDPAESTPYINDVSVRIRAGILLVIPLFMGLTLYDVIYSSKWIVDGDTIVDTYDTDWDGNIIYAVQATRRTYDYTVQTWVLLYALFEMICGMFVLTSRLSPSILISSYLGHSRPAVWKPLVPKRFAWVIGASLISVCLVFFNPDTFAGWVNALFRAELLPTTVNFLPYWIPLVLVWVCLGLMWMEAVLGYCLGCQIHALMVRFGLIEEACDACNNISWDRAVKETEG